MMSQDQSDCWYSPYDQLELGKQKEQLQQLENVTPKNISSKEILRRLKDLSKTNVYTASMSAQQSDRNNQVNVKDSGCLSITVTGNNNSITVADSKRTHTNVETSTKPSQDMEQEVNRLATFNAWPHSAPVSANALARAGFFFMGIDDQVKCFACQGIIRDWEFGDTAMGEHKKHFTRCPFVRNPNFKNIPLDMENAISGAIGCGSVDKRAEEKAAGLFKASRNDTKKSQAGKKGSGKQVKSKGFDESEKTREGNPTRQPTIDSAETEMRLTFRSEYRRLLSFQDWPRTSPIEPRDLAKAGFYYLEKDDIAQCFACFGKIRDWEPQDIPMHEHMRHFPNCPFVMGHDVKNEPITALQAANAVSMTYREPSGFASTLQHFSKQLEEALPQTAKVTNQWELMPSPNRVPDKPKYPNYTGENARIATFGARWPGVLGITPQQLARAGFFFTGEGDSTKCFYCGGGLKHWESTDEPWTEHAKWFPVCEWLLQQRGQTFVSYVVRNFPVDTSQLQRAREQKGKMTEASASGAAKAAPSELAASASSDPPEEEAGVIYKKAAAPGEIPLDLAMNSRLTKRVLEMGYDSDLVRQVIRRRLRTAGKEFELTSDLLDAVWQAEENREADKVEEQGGASGKAEKFTQEIPEKQGKDVRSADAEVSGLTRKLKGLGFKNHPTATVGHVQEGGQREREQPKSPDEIEREIERLRDERLCKVCMDNEANTVLMPCTHLVVCDRCASSLGQCPICRQTIRNVVKVFKS